MALNIDLYRKVDFLRDLARMAELRSVARQVLIAQGETCTCSHKLAEHWSHGVCRWLRCECRHFATNPGAGMLYIDMEKRIKALEQGYRKDWAANGRWFSALRKAKAEYAQAGLSWEEQARLEKKIRFLKMVVAMLLEGYEDEPTQPLRLAPTAEPRKAFVPMVVASQCLLCTETPETGRAFCKAHLPDPRYAR